MKQSYVWFSPGSRMDVAFAAADLKIRALKGFISDVAASIAAGESLSKAARTAALRHPAAAAAFDLESPNLDTQFALSDALTFPNEPLPELLSFEKQTKRMSLRLDGVLARDAKSLLELCGAGRWTADEIHDALDYPMSALFDSLLENEIVAAGSPPENLDLALKRPGVTRLQHAGLFYRGREAGVLVDPHLHSSYEPHDLSGNFLRSQFEGHVDAILISHSHEDHWHLPTLMTFPSDMLIVVPKVSRSSMLCPDFAATLRALGFTRVVTLGWFDPPLKIGDLEVHALPFYGEQPLLKEAPRHPDLRNQGNTYVVRHDSYTSWFLIDSGNDWTGHMSQVAYDVKERFGRIDMLLSNLREFTPFTPQYITGGHYWLSLTADQIRRFPSMSNDVITLGPKGVAEICHIVQARSVFPYAHWWGDIGETPEHERLLTELLHAQLAEFGATTKIEPWRIGDNYQAEAKGADRPYF